MAYLLDWGISVALIFPVAYFQCLIWSNIEQNVKKYKPLASTVTFLPRSTVTNFYENKPWLFI